MSKNILELTNVTKNFPGVKALDEANFKLKKGSIHALLGENGAGTVSYTHLTLPTIYSV